MDHLLSEVGENLVPIIIATAIVIGLAITSIKNIVISTSRERTRREIAAYVAEGSMTPEHGERLLKAESRGAGGIEV